MWPRNEEPIKAMQAQQMGKAQPPGWNVSAVLIRIFEEAD